MIKQQSIHPSWAIKRGRDNDVQAYMKSFITEGDYILMDGTQIVSNSQNIPLSRAEHTYMQEEQTLTGWMLVNHICLQWYQYLYVELNNKKLIKKYQ